MWLLDTNIWIRYLSTEPGRVAQKIAQTNPEQLFMCDVVKAELLFGAYKSQRVDANLAKLQTLFSLVNSFPFDADAANYFGKIRAFLHQQGTPIGPYDLQIAAIARAQNLILVTHNTREFSRVPELICEDWV